MGGGLDRSCLWGLSSKKVTDLKEKSSYQINEYHIIPRLSIVHGPLLKLTLLLLKSNMMRGDHGRFFLCFVSNCPNITWGFLREDGTATASLTSMLVRKRRDLESPGLEKQRYEVETLNGTFQSWFFLVWVVWCVCVCHVKLFFDYSWFEHLNMQYSYSHVQCGVCELLSITIINIVIQQLLLQMCFWI